MIPHLILALALAPGQQVVQAEAQAGEAETICKRADQEVQGGDVDQALKDYDRSIQLNDSWSCRFNRGLLELRVGANEQAADDFDRAVVANQGHTAIALYYGAIALSNRTLARENMRRQLHPDVDDYEEAINKCKELMNLPGVPDGNKRSAQRLIGVTSVLEGELFLEMNQPQEAIDRVKVGLDNLSPMDHHWRSEAYTIAGRAASDGPAWQQALDNLHAATKEAEQTQEPFELAKTLSYTLAVERDKTKQLELLDRFRDISFEGQPNSSHLNTWRALQIASFYLSQKDLQAAQTELAKITNDPDLRTAQDLRSQYFVLSATISLAAGDQEALQRADAEIEPRLNEIDSDSEEALELRMLQAELAARTDDYQRVLSLGEKIQEQIFQSLGSKPSNLAAFPTERLAFILNTLARTYLQMGMLPQGLELIRRSISLYQEMHRVEEELGSKILYAEFWALIDPKGEENTPKAPEWKLTLDQMAPQLASLDPRAKNDYHVIYAIGLLGMGNARAARHEMTLVDRSLADGDFKTQLALIDGSIAVNDKDFVAASNALALLDGQLDHLVPSDRNEYLQIRASVERQRGDLRNATLDFGKAIDLSDRLSSQSPAAEFQADLRDTRAALYDEAIGTTVDSEGQIRSPYQGQFTEFVLKALIPPQPVQHTGRGEELDLVLGRLADHHRVFKLRPEYSKVHPSLNVTDADLRAAYRRDVARYFSLLPRAQNAQEVTTRHSKAIAFLAQRSRKSEYQVRLYYLGRTSGAILVFERGSIIHRFVINKDDLATLSTLTAKWKDEIETLADQTNDARSHSRRLLSILFPEGWQSTPKEIEIVAHEQLWDLAFETLVTSPADNKQVRYLDEDRLISYLAPVTVSRGASQPATSKAPTRQNGFFFLNPTMSEPGVLPLEDDPKLMMDLSAIGIPKTRLIAGAMASEAKVFSPAVQNADWLHFLTHSADENQWEPQVGLLLAADASTTSSTLVYSSQQHMLALTRKLNYQTDGFLSPRDIETMTLHTRFVFLHGCQTSRSRVSFSTGLLGLVSAFLSAGSQSVIASHWNVAINDDITTPVVHFYRDVDESGESLESLTAHLRAEIRSSGQFGAHPYAWAAFSIYH